MASLDIKKLVKEEVAKALVTESLISIEHLHDGISTSTMTGRPWFQLVNALESVINEVNDFNGQYSSSRHGPLPNTRGAMVQLQMVVKLLESVKPVIIGMDDIERKDV